MEFDTVETAYKFYKEKPALYKEAKKITRDNDLLDKIYNNQRLFKRVANSECVMSVDLSETIHDFAVRNDEFLIYFTDIGVYGVFTPSQYKDFVGNIRDDVDDLGIKVDIYQVVLAGTKQKFVFACTDPKYFDKLKNYAKKCFDAPVSYSNNQITVDLPMLTEIDIIESYDKLCTYISKAKDDECCESMRQIPVMSSLTGKYRKYSCNDTLTIRSLEDLSKVLRGNITLTGPVIIMNNTVGNVNMNVGNGNVVNAGAGGNIEEWIRQNPPAVGEATSAYHKRYIDASKHAISANGFGPIAKKVLGRSPVRGSHFRHW